MTDRYACNHTFTLMYFFSEVWLFCKVLTELKLEEQNEWGLYVCLHARLCLWFWKKLSLWACPEGHTLCYTVSYKLSNSSHCFYVISEFADQYFLKYPKFWQRSTSLERCDCRHYLSALKEMICKEIRSYNKGTIAAVSCRTFSQN